MDNQIKPQVLQSKKIFAVVAGVLVLGAGVFAYTYLGNSNSADGSNPPGITIDYPKFKGEMNPNVICNIPKAYKFTSDADSKYKTGDAEAKDLQSGIHMYHSDTDIFVQDIIDRIDSVSGNVILIAYYPSSGNPSNLFSVFPELKGQNAISATAAKTYKIPANEGFTIFSCKASKIYGIKTETEFGSDLPAILKSKADSGWVLMAAKKPASGKDVKKEMKEVNDDNKSKNKPKIKSAWPQKGKGFSFAGSQQPDALAVDSTYKMVWVEMSTEDIKKDPTPELTLYATNGSEVSVKKGDTVVLDFIELMSSNKVANVKSIDFSNAGTDVLANLSGYKLFSSIKSDDGKTLKDAKEVTGCTIKPVSLKINVTCTTGSLSVNPASPLYLELRATIAQTAVLTKTFKLSIASLDDIKIYESGFKKNNYYASPAYTAGGKSAINLPIYWNTYTVSEAAAPAAISVPTGLSFDKTSKTLTWDQSTGTVDSYSIEVYSKGVPTILPKVKDNNAKQSLSISGYDSNFAYSFKVKACNGATCSTYSETYVVEAAAPAALSAPTKLAFDIKTCTLSWTASTGPVKTYTVEPLIEAKSQGLFPPDTGKTTQTTLGSCSESTSYVFKVRAVDASGKDGPVAELAVPATKVASAALSAPEKLTVKSFTTNSIEITWDKPSGMSVSSIKGYYLFYGTGTVVDANPPLSSKINVVMNADGSALYKTPETLTPNTNYWFSVKTVDSDYKESTAATLNTAKTKAEEAPKVAQPPSAPANFKLVSKTDSSAFFNWDKPTSDGGSPVTKYNLFYGPGICTGTNATKNDLILVNYPYDEIKGLSESTAYGAYVRATNNVNNDTNWSEKSVCVDFTTESKKSTAPAVSGDPTFQYIFDTSARVYWDAVNVDTLNGKFKVNYRKGGCSAPSTEEVVVSSWDAKNSSAPPSYVKILGTPYTTYDLNPGTKYGVTVKVSNDGTTWSAESTCKEFTTTGKAIIPEVITLYDLVNDGYGECNAGETSVPVALNSHVCKPTSKQLPLYQCNAKYTCSGGVYGCIFGYKCAGTATCDGKTNTNGICAGTYTCSSGLSCDSYTDACINGTKTCQ